MPWFRGFGALGGLRLAFRPGFDGLAQAFVGRGVKAFVAGYGRKYRGLRKYNGAGQGRSSDSYMHVP
jgi:hypothetical protein